MQVCYSDRYTIRLDPSHPFPMGKYRAVRDRLLEDGSISYWNLKEPGLVDEQDARLVHTNDYWQSLLRGALTPSEVRRIGFPWSEALVRRARAAVQGTILASRAALRDGIASNLAGGTHHAFPDHGEGYCVLNDIAIATRALQRDHLAKRIAIIDCDVHQGNGTAAIFRTDPDVFTFSMHCDNNYPLRKEESRLDVELRVGTGDEEYMDKLHAALPIVLDDFQPDFVFYQAGVDPLEGDRLGKLRLSIEGLERRDELVIRTCLERGVSTVTTMGGGYAKQTENTVEAHSNTVRAALKCQRFNSASPAGA